MPAYRATTLYDCPELARRYGVGRVLVKAETQRLGLPSFKILGASWATYRALSDHLGFEPEPWANINDLSRRIGYLRPFSLAAATDGNHGRAVAFMARLLGFGCRIFVPAGTVPARIHAIQNEGAEVTVVDGDYDAAVARSAEEASDKCLVISDTSWPGYDVTPRRVVDGYTTIFMEIEQALAAAGIGAPDVVVVPMGVGAFMSAAVSYYRSRPWKGALVGVEPADANCIQVSAKAGEMTAVPGPHRSIMVGLNCGLPSPVAWPRVSTGVDWMVSIGDERAREAMRGLADCGSRRGGDRGGGARGARRAPRRRLDGRVPRQRPSRARQDRSPDDHGRGDGPRELPGRRRAVARGDRDDPHRGPLNVRGVPDEPGAHDPEVRELDSIRTGKR